MHTGKVKGEQKNKLYIITTYIPSNSLASRVATLSSSSPSRAGSAGKHREFFFLSLLFFFLFFLFFSFFSRGGNGGFFPPSLFCRCWHSVRGGESARESGRSLFAPFSFCESGLEPSQLPVLRPACVQFELEARSITADHLFSLVRGHRLFS